VPRRSALIRKQKCKVKKVVEGWCRWALAGSFAFGLSGLLLGLAGEEVQRGSRVVLRDHKTSKRHDSTGREKKTTRNEQGRGEAQKSGRTGSTLRRLKSESDRRDGFRKVTPRRWCAYSVAERAKGKEGHSKRTRGTKSLGGNNSRPRREERSIPEVCVPCWVLCDDRGCPERLPWRTYRKG
jgi:hypothetical protein